MTNPVQDSKFAERLFERIDELDKGAIDMMAGGMLKDFGEYRHSGGYRSALAHVKIVAKEILKDILEE